jgi:FAD/FMN-containing dehydrogenase
MKIMVSKSNRSQFNSWGRYPSLPSEVVALSWASEFPLHPKPSGKMLPVGLGRSYGDVCLLEEGTLIKTRQLDHFLGFDSTTGILRAEAGVSFAEILRLCIPRGWFLPVTPGTKYVTVGGAIANDIHGKNHHVAGTFGCHVLRMGLIRSDGTYIECSPAENTDWYCATIGGMGLTGLITWADIQMRPIVSPQIDYEGTKFRGIDEFLALSEAAKDIEYTVAWIDCVSGGKNFARGIFMQGAHSEISSQLATGKEPWLNFPCNLPQFFLNRYSVRAFNEVFYRKQLRSHVKTIVNYEPFFYPLDAILNWNRMYGKEGLLQFQCVLPWEQGKQGLLSLLKDITASGMASFLAVLKVFGNVASPGMMSFPQPGITLALDFPIRKDKSFRLFDRLADITAAHSGRLYSAKDARMRPEHFQRFYPQWQQFSSYIDPQFDSSFWQRVTADV